MSFYLPGAGSGDEAGNKLTSPYGLGLAGPRPTGMPAALYPGMVGMQSLQMMQAHNMAMYGGVPPGHMPMALPGQPSGGLILNPAALPPGSLPPPNLRPPPLDPPPPAHLLAFQPPPSRANLNGHLVTSPTKESQQPDVNGHQEPPSRGGSTPTDAFPPPVEANGNAAAPHERPSANNLLSAAGSSLGGRGSPYTRTTMAGPPNSTSPSITTQAASNMPGSMGQPVVPYPSFPCGPPGSRAPPSAYHSVPGNHVNHHPTFSGEPLLSYPSSAQPAATSSAQYGSVPPTGAPIHAVPPSSIHGIQQTAPPRSAHASLLGDPLSGLSVMPPSPFLGGFGGSGEPYGGLAAPHLPYSTRLSGMTGAPPTFAPASRAQVARDVCVSYPSSSHSVATQAAPTTYQMAAMPAGYPGFAVYPPGAGGGSSYVTDAVVSRAALHNHATSSQLYPPAFAAGPPMYAAYPSGLGPNAVYSPAHTMIPFGAAGSGALPHGMTLSPPAGLPPSTAMAYPPQPGLPTLYR